MGCSFSSSPSFRTCLKPPDPDGGNLLPLDEPVGRRSRDAQVLGDLGDVHMCVAEAVSIGSRRGRFSVAACGIPEALGYIITDSPRRVRIAPDLEDAASHCPPLSDIFCHLVPFGAREWHPLHA